MNKELLEAMEVLEKEKNIAKDTLIEAIENSLLTACKNHFGKADNVKVTVNPNTCDFAVYAEKTVVEQVEDDIMEISLADAKMLSPKYDLGDTVQIPLDSKKFGRIATQNAKNVILQKIREEERKVLYNEYYTKEKDFIRSMGKDVDVRLYRQIDKQKEFTGALSAYDENTVTLTMEDGSKMVFEKPDIALIRLALDF